MNDSERRDWVNNDEGLYTYHPNMYGHKVNLIHPEDISPCDAYLVALPIEAAIEVCANLLELGGKLIDLSAAFRSRCVHNETREAALIKDLFRKRKLETAEIDMILGRKEKP